MKKGNVMPLRKLVINAVKTVDDHDKRRNVKNTRIKVLSRERTTNIKSDFKQRMLLSEFLRKVMFGCLVSNLSPHFHLVGRCEKHNRVERDEKKFKSGSKQQWRRSENGSASAIIAHFIFATIFFAFFELGILGDRQVLTFNKSLFLFLSVFKWKISLWLSKYNDIIIFEILQFSIKKMEILAEKKFIIVSKADVRVIKYTNQIKTLLKLMGALSVCVSSKTTKRRGNLQPTRHVKYMKYGIAKDAVFILGKSPHLVKRFKTFTRLGL
ncbi:hypothetical protein EGR_00646 [Echinococcus granulosus]|uniref:Uncharacterized protein n=1 Tax=Echinococcus granulosus TaxID=6210 RepID=W6UVM4_ECHGR|nr:hypothetical protein EGR_00646 [Echinococcus granulosus]EUB64696.1 hypothetical protein EGR_00646 [Echinococcus granulosus]